MSKRVADIIVETLRSAGVKHCYVALQEVLTAAAWGDGKRVDTHVLRGALASSAIASSAARGR